MKRQNENQTYEEYTYCNIYRTISCMRFVASMHWIIRDSLPLDKCNSFFEDCASESRFPTWPQYRRLRLQSLLSPTSFMSIIYCTNTRTSAFDNYSSCRINCRWNCSAKSYLRLWTRPLASPVLPSNWFIIRFRFVFSKFSPL